MSRRRSHGPSRSFLLAPLATLLVPGWLRAAAPEPAAAGPARTGQALTLCGQLVCPGCYAEADRTKVPYGTAADKECAARCARMGTEPALAVNTGTSIELYVLDGKSPAEEGWLPHMGEHARVSGLAEHGSGGPRILVDSFAFLPPSPLDARANAGLLGLAPELELGDMEGRKHKLSGYRGKIVVLNFWATWCGPCRKELRDLAHLQGVFDPGDVQLVGASVDAPEAREVIRKLVREAGVTYPIWVGADTDHLDAFGFTPSIPATAILDREGRIVWRKGGLAREAELRAEVERLLRPVVGACVAGSAATAH